MKKTDMQIQKTQVNTDGKKAQTAVTPFTSEELNIILIVLNGSQVAGEKDMMFMLALISKVKAMLVETVVKG